jgi:hypothetical protein
MKYVPIGAATMASVNPSSLYMTDLGGVSLGSITCTLMPHASTAGAISDLPGSRVVPSATAFSAGTLRREVMFKVGSRLKAGNNSR